MEYAHSFESLKLIGSLINGYDKISRILRGVPPNRKQRNAIPGQRTFQGRNVFEGGVDSIQPWNAALKFPVTRESIPPRVILFIYIQLESLARSWTSRDISIRTGDFLFHFRMGFVTRPETRETKPRFAGVTRAAFLNLSVPFLHDTPFFSFFFLQSTKVVLFEKGEKNTFCSARYSRSRRVSLPEKQSRDTAACRHRLTKSRL